MSDDAVATNVMVIKEAGAILCGVFASGRSPSMGQFFSNSRRTRTRLVLVGRSAHFRQSAVQESIKHEWKVCPGRETIVAYLMIVKRKSITRESFPIGRGGERNALQQVVYVIDCVFSHVLA